MNNTSKSMTYRRYKYVPFETLLGKTFTQVVRDDESKGVKFLTTDGEEFLMHHAQDCCEDVHIESIVGDLGDLVDSPILLAEEVCERGRDPEEFSCTYTFYKLATVKGYVDIRWVGTSNGYYSEGVDLAQLVDG